MDFYDILGFSLFVLEVIVVLKNIFDKLLLLKQMPLQVCGKYVNIFLLCKLIHFALSTVSLTLSIQCILYNVYYVYNVYYT